MGTCLDDCWDYNNGTSEIRVGKALRARLTTFSTTNLSGSRILAAIVFCENRK